MSKHNDNINNMGKQLLDARKNSGTTQKEVANELGISQGDFSRMERRDNHFMLNFSKWADVLGYKLVLVKK